MFTRKRRALSMSNFIVYPLFAMFFAAIFSVSQNTQNGLLQPNSGILLNGTAQVCVNRPDNISSCLSSNSNNKPVILTTCSFFNVLCKLQCFVFGQTSTTCINAINGQSPFQTLLSQKNPNPQPLSAAGVINSIFTLGQGNGFINILLILVGGIILAGITLFGSGISSASIYLATLIIAYTALWLFLSALSGSTFTNMPTINDVVCNPICTTNVQISTGQVLYGILTFMYVLGVLQRIG